MQRALLTLALTAALAACSSAPKTGANADGSQAGSSAGQSTVTPVGVGATDGVRGGPQDVARTVFFDFDSYSVRPDARPVVEGQARWLNANRGTGVVLEGHTDEIGGSEYNLALGQRRAEAVRRALVLQGVQDSQIEAVSFGKEQPAVPGAGNDERNRRVEFRYR